MILYKFYVIKSKNNKLNRYADTNTETSTKKPAHIQSKHINTHLMSIWVQCTNVGR